MLLCYRVGLKCALRPTRKKHTISIATLSSAQRLGKQLFSSGVIYGYCWRHRSGWARSWPLPSLRKQLPHSNIALCVKLTIYWFRELTNKNGVGFNVANDDSKSDLSSLDRRCLSIYFRPDINQAHPKTIAEEKRLFYVAATRTIDQLFLSGLPALVLSCRTGCGVF